ncbi:unnamed protein product [Prorocentrum cordatum]|uniref:Uncharacterized protein n=1 Tax=Prorocentrum cordatum TaxID=2364126 RepID=A0ABN9QB17_9DINO|nr:unnamed protein product [Polarella glacialis]
MTATELVQPLALGQAREGLPPKPAHPVLGGKRYGEWLRDQRTEGKEPWLQGWGRAEMSQDEDAMIDFVIILAVASARTEGTAKQKLFFAIRHAHLIVGYSDPLLHRGRPWTTLAGLKRLQGPSHRRQQPVTPRTLARLEQPIHLDAGLGPADAATVYAATMLAFIFLQRASEHLVGDKSWSLESEVHGEYVEARSSGERVGSMTHADECALRIKGSKTDQCNAGAARNQSATQSTLCPITALAAMQAQRPQRFDHGRGEAAPVLVGLGRTGEARGGAALPRAGKPRVGRSRSLRIGGAAAMYHVTGDIAKAQEGAAGISAGQATSGGLSALGRAAATAVTPGHAAAARRELSTMKKDEGHISLHLSEGRSDVVNAIPMWTAAKPKGPREAPGEANASKPRPPKKPKAVYCDAGAQGSDQFNGARYLHKNPGFQRGDEVAREVADKQHRD